MTREEVIKIMQSGKPDNYSDFLQFAKDEYMAKLLAIKSLEAWEKVKEEIESNMVSLDGLYSYQKSFHNNCNNVRKECIEIINKHLSEVSE